MRSKRLFIAGRSKEVIIARGKNHYPVDIESTIQRQLPQLAISPVVFSCELDGEERAVVLQALDLASVHDYAALARAMIASVSQTHGLELFDICFVRPEDVPKTGSGKIQRSACRDAYVHGSLPILCRSRGANLQHRASVQTAAASPVRRGSRNRQ